jgi:APA family basic amino acid/polyamine antiporter
MSTVKDTTKTGISPTHFTRNATGLVRDVSPFSAGVYNMATASPGLFGAISAFFALSVFPHANIIVSTLLVFPIALVVAITFGTLQSTMPRSGGDYVMVSRLLHPALGVSSTLLNSFGAVIGMGFFGVSFAKLGVQPLVAIVGTVNRSQDWINASNQLNSQAWTISLSLLYLAAGITIVALPIRTAMRIQNFCAVVAMTGFVIGLFVLWLTPKGTFIAHYNQYAGSGAYERVLQAGGQASYNLRDTILAMGTIATFTVFQWWSIYFSGEIKSLGRTSVTTMVAPTIVYFIALLLLFGAVQTRFDHGFVVAANANDRAYTLTAPPFWTLLASIGGGSRVLAVFLSVTFIFWLPLLAIVQLLPPIRTAFAMALDGVIPQVFAKVDRRTHIPVKALLLVSVCSTATTLWAVYGSSSFFSAFVYASFFVIITMMIVAIAGIALPYRFPDLWKASPGAKKFAGIPVITVLAALMLLGSVFIEGLWAGWPEFGIESGRRGLFYAGVIMLAGIALYYLATFVHKKTDGVDISLNYHEIPPE